MVSDDEVKKIARLARLEIEPEFIPVATSHMNSILEYVEVLKKVDTSHVEAMSHVSNSTNVLRKDAMLPPSAFSAASPLGPAEIPQQPMLPTDALVKNAPDINGTFIKVPLIVE